MLVLGVLSLLIDSFCCLPVGVDALFWVCVVNCVRLVFGLD